MVCNYCRGEESNIIAEYTRFEKNNVLQCKNCGLVYLEIKKGKKQERHFFPCSVCGAHSMGSFKRLYDFGRFSQRQTVSVCKNCGTVCLNPRWDERKYEEYYQSQYYGEYQLRIIDKGYDDIKDSSRGIKIFNDLREYLDKDAKIIEIGCGEGGNLIVFQKDGFKNLTGLEPSLDCCRKLQKFSNINCINETLASYVLNFNASRRFDCIILSHMLEHFVEPEKALEMISSIMETQGVLYILVPNFYGSEPYSQFTIPHTFYFSKASLEILLNNSGFIVDKYFESPVNEIALVARKSSRKPIPITNNVSEYKRVLFYLRKNKLQSVKNVILKMLDILVMIVLTEDTYLAIRHYLRRFKIFDILSRILR